MVFSKLAFSRRLKACQPSSSVRARHKAMTQGRWLKKTRSTAVPLAVSKSSRRATTGWSSRGESACMLGFFYKGSRQGLPAQAAQAGVAQMVFVGQGQASSGQGTTVGRNAVEADTVVAAEQQLTGLAEQRQSARVQLSSGADRHRQAGFQLVPVFPLIGAAHGIAAQPIGNQTARARPQQAEETAFVGRSQGVKALTGIV